MEIEGRIVQHFSLEEMANTQTTDKVKLRLDTPEAVEHAFMMEELRMWAVRTYPKVFTRGLSASSWYRSKEFNARKSVGGDKNSEHLDARATDINNIPANLYASFTTAWKAICAKHKKVGCVNYYGWGMHFGSHADKFGHKTFQIREYR